MSETVIKVEGVTKEYTLGVISHRTLYREIQSKVSRLMKKEDPNTIVGIEKNRLRAGRFHALDDINIEVKQGDVVGIIGKNGAGKSTLLKLLSRVTIPTKGEIRIKGRIASLLEVGTGFHPELTGRENIYLNGAILGMKKKEISRKFDDIVDFSGVSEFIDTPVKRYSSGMYVRLAFAVAAHLDPEILIVDEVLAVGDAEFRKKCLGKMNEVSKTGKTILFVSHEMSAITSLCNRGILLESGKVVCTGDINTVVNQYTFKIAKQATHKVWNENQPGDEYVCLHSVRLTDSRGASIQTVALGEAFAIEMVYDILADGQRINPGVTVYSSGGQVLLVSFPESTQIETKKGTYKVSCRFPPNLLNADIFSVRINTHSFYPTSVHFDIPDAIHFEVIEYNIENRTIDYKDKLYGAVRTKLDWQVQELAVLTH